MNLLGSSPEDVFNVFALSPIKPFLPSDLSGLVRWFRGSSLVGADGDPISSWADESPETKAVTALTIVRPSISATGINGRRCASFNGVANVLRGVDTNLPTGDTSLFCVSYSNTMATQVISHYGLASTGSSVFALYQQFSNTSFAGSQFGASVTPLGTPSALGSPMVMSLTKSGTLWNIWENGGLNGSATLTTNTTLGSDFALGGGNSAFPGTFLTGMIGEVIIYSRVLSTIERQQVESYLSSSWAILF